MSRFLWFSVYTGFPRLGPANVTGHDINGNIIKEWGQLPPNLIPFCKKMRMIPKDALYTCVLNVIKFAGYVGQRGSYVQVKKGWC